ncbi:malate dehydrogenase (quinone) [Phytohalomonas tamaricis]|uniref:malate dehydrogenase (quinone) n=1 Tax=Phytohalomonas tamaricis TaxID=2081032 RepID=UPI000D0B3E8E|nr:malate dehydrogenase (quinone) [Phytohalomonas tamaricis]
MKKHIIAALCLSLSVLSVQAQAEDSAPVDVVLIGGGIMSTTLGTYLEELEPDWTIAMYERLDKVAEESSNGWNNAGTGHSAFCEMNYTPEREDGTIDVSKPPKITEGFEISRQFWAHQVKRGVLENPHSFINTTPHMSFVWGDDNVAYLHKRYDTMQQNALYKGMQYSEDPAQIKQWAPLIMEGRDPSQKVAATWMPVGTDVNYGEITRQLAGSLTKHDRFTLSLNSEVRDIKRNDDGTWKVTVADLSNNGQETSVNAKFVFIGAGGAALPLLQKSGIPEADGYAGFPVGGQFLVTTNPEVVSRHNVKAYGKAAVGSPPMSVPHIDARQIDGKSAVLFGPFATFSTKFLKNGSLTDLFGSMTTSNTWPMAQVGMDHFDLVQYLVGQLMLSEDDRFEALREYYPEARKADWKLWTAGQRVQIIKKNADGDGILQFGTEVVSSEDGSISALLGASPGASTAAPIMLHLMEKVFKDKVASEQWQAKLKEIIPSYGQSMDNNAELISQVRGYTNNVLQLEGADAAPSNEEKEVTAQL